ncbi:MAG TPA: hypothetical protein VNN77_08080 [candidate division Zixibacteria bacterium]|nr:hypothetical protein [candidate division Zixibacteria bacterium]
MWSRLYRDHAVIPFPSFDTACNGWTPQAAISWWAGPKRAFQFVRFSDRVQTEEEAVERAWARAQAWIDERLAGKLSERRVIDIIDSLKQDVARSSSPEPVCGPVETFTFEQFKSVISKTGLRLSPRLLQKSYASLLKLRREQHWSWAEIRQKVENSRQGLGTATARRGPKRAPIPVTERDWRRIS